MAVVNIYVGPYRYVGSCRYEGEYAALNTDSMSPAVRPLYAAIPDECRNLSESRRAEFIKMHGYPPTPPPAEDDRKHWVSIDLSTCTTPVVHETIGWSFADRRSAEHFATHEITAEKVEQRLLEITRSCEESRCAFSMKSSRS